MHIRFATAVAFLSGFVALGYEILWARRVSDIIGATSFASSLVVGVFFMALAAGALLIGPRATRSANPWRFYAKLELAILVAILPSFFGEQLAHFIFGVFGDILLRNPMSFFVKTALAVMFVGPASFLMGGTLPAMGQAVVRSSDRLGREGNALYGINTLGAAFGILCTTFLLIPRFGMYQSFAVLMLGSLILAFAAQWIGNRPTVPARGPAPGRDAGKQSPDKIPATVQEREPLPEILWNSLAFLSGFIVLGLEILALHLFSQVLHNSTYTFASVLVVVILALSVGALITQRRSLLPRQAWHGAGVVLLLGALFTALLPRLFFMVTDDMSPFSGGGAGLTLYIVRILGVGALVLGPPFVLLGWVFPFILAGSGSGTSTDNNKPAIGQRWGRLLAINAAGALLGITLVNHVAMPQLGLWLSITMWCLAALIAGALVTLRSTGNTRWILWGLILCVACGLIWSKPRAQPMARVDKGERILAWSAGADGIATVIERNEPYRDKRIKWNNTYSLGGASNAGQQMRLGFIPLMLHPRPRNTVFIGLATGITAGSALRDPTKPKVTTVELSPQITRLACEHFDLLSAKLCSHERSTVVVEDGRMFFQSTRDTFDVVVGDLFVPWRAGVANLFTREHFSAVRSRLHEDGLFAQWLPLFQMDEAAFWGIATTFAEVFPNAWLAIADFQPHNAGVALIGWKKSSGAPSWEVMQLRSDQFANDRRNRDGMLRSAEGLGMFLVGPVAPALPGNIPIMTTNRPWLGDHAARVERMQPSPTFQGSLLISQLQRIANRVPGGPLRDAVITGQIVYQFCGITESQGMEVATQWFDTHMTRDLPDVMAQRNVKHWGWPFPEQAGRFLLRRAQEDANRK